jgi:hypothetical protein
MTELGEVILHEAESGMLSSLVVFTMLIQSGHVG